MNGTVFSHHRQQPDSGLRNASWMSGVCDRLIGGIAVALTAAMALAACSAGAGTAQAGNGSTAPGQLLTIGSTTGPAPSLDPAKIDPAALFYDEAAYDSLLYQAPDGSLQPDLAVRWGFRGSGYTTFQLTLRSGVRFSDGSALTAQVVKAWLEYFKAALGPDSTEASDIASVTTSGTYTVTLQLSKPDPELPLLLSQNYLMGDVVSGPGLSHPSELATRTAGAGPYVLEPGQSVTGDYYTYLPNPYYWDKTLIHYKKIKIEVITNDETTLNALRTGQIDVAEGDLSTVTAARAAGLQVVARSANVIGLALADRAGTKAPPLAKVQVRQAINYAINRDAIASGLFGPYGTVTSQLTRPGLQGYDPQLNDAYPYDPAKAKQLLAAAGYPDGITLPVLSTSLLDIDLITQAIASQLSKVGIHLQIHSDGTFTQYANDLVAGAYPVISFDFGVGDYYQESTTEYLPDAQLNPFHSQDALIEQLYNAAQTQGGAARTATYQKIAARISALAWFAPVILQDRFIFAQPSVAGVQAWTGVTANPDLRDWYPAGK
jgi:peptide/nickel transport system substrate-binding protein